MLPTVGKFPDSCIKTASSVQEFLAYLLPSATHWESAGYGDLAFRGHASSRWDLVPKAFRDNQLLGYNYDARTPSLIRVEPQSQAEFNVVHQFVRAADRTGLPITESGGRLLLQDDPKDIFKNRKWEYYWPQPDILETVALAQHHGVPTRLLDFTEEPLTAAYFAASFAWDPEKRRRRRAKLGTHLAVWVIDLRFIRALNRISHRYPERLVEVRVPRANNSYLHAQFGFFLVDRGSNDEMARRKPSSIDEIILDRARYWHQGNRLSGKGVRQSWFDELPIRQVRLRLTYTEALLCELENRGVTKSGVMPSFDRVVESLEFGRSISRPTGT